MVSRRTPHCATASANSSPSRKLSRDNVGTSGTFRIASRTSGGYGMVLVATTWMRSSMSTIATSMPSADVPLIRPATLMRRAVSRALQLLLQFVQQLQRFDGPQLIHFQIADALGDAVIHRLKKLDLHRPGRARRQLFGHRVLGTLVQSQNVAGPLDHRNREAGQSRDFDP